MTPSTSKDRLKPSSHSSHLQFQNRTLRGLSKVVYMNEEQTVGPPIHEDLEAGVDVCDDRKTV